MREWRIEPVGGIDDEGGDVERDRTVILPFEIAFQGFDVIDAGMDGVAFSLVLPLLESFGDFLDRRVAVNLPHVCPFEQGAELASRALSAKIGLQDRRGIGRKQAVGAVEEEGDSLSTQFL